MNMNINFQTSPHFRIHFFFFKDLIVTLGFSRAPVAFPLQYVANHDPQQAQQEEDRHQDEGSVLWVYFVFNSTTNCSFVLWSI